MDEVRTHNDIFYLPRTTTSSCFNILALENVTLELKPQYTHTLPKFTGKEDAYLFLGEFEEICSSYATLMCLLVLRHYNLFLWL